MTIAAAPNAITTLAKMPVKMPSTGPARITLSTSRGPPGSVQNATPIDAPTSSEMIDTVVDVGNPKELKRSSSSTSDTITAR